MKTDKARTQPAPRSNEREQDAKERWDAEGGTPAGHAPAIRETLRARSANTRQETP